MSDGNGVTPIKHPPSLVGSAPSSSATLKATGAEPRILAGLSGKGAKGASGLARPAGPRSARRGAWIGAVAVLALAVVAGGVWHAQQNADRDTPPTIARAPSDAGDGTRSVIEHAQRSAAADAASGSTTPVQAAGNAATQAQPPVQSATIVDDTSAQDANRLSSVSQPARAPIQAAPRKEPAHALAAKNGADDLHRRTTGVTEAANAKPKHAEPKMTRHERVLAERDERTNDRAKTATRTKSADPDAEILAALFRHAGADDARKVPPRAAKGDSPALQHGARTSLAAQVEACHSKGFFNGEVCRWQVCNGHWGSDPVCPGHEPSSQSAAAH